MNRGEKSWQNYHAHLWNGFFDRPVQSESPMQLPKHFGKLLRKKLSTWLSVHAITHSTLTGRRSRERTSRLHGEKGKSLPAVA